MSSKKMMQCSVFTKEIVWGFTSEIPERDNALLHIQGCLFTAFMLSSSYNNKPADILFLLEVSRSQALLPKAVSGNFFFPPSLMIA